MTESDRNQTIWLPNAFRWGLLIGIALAAPKATGAPPTLEHLFPAGGQRGSQVVTTCTGEFAWPVKVWAPGAEVNVSSETGKLEISIPDDYPSDQLWIRLYNDEGSSAVVPFLVGNLAEVEEQEPNNSLHNAQSAAAAGVTVNGALKERGDVDGFAVQLVAGQTLVAAVDAHSRLNSPMDAMLQVTSADGTVLAANHDSVGLDPRIVFTASQSGVHIVRLFAFPAEPDTNIAYRGAPSYIYRLTLTTGPYVTHALPLTVSSLEPAHAGALGWNLPADARLPVISLVETPLAELLEDEIARDIRVYPEAHLGFACAAEMAGAAQVRLIPHAATSSTADPADQPKALELPSATTGCLTVPGQSNLYRLELQQGQHVVIAVEAPSLRLPTAPDVQLIDPTGTTVAETPSRGPVQDAVITYSTTSQGEYRIVVRDRFRHGGDRYCYRLSVHDDQSNARLTASADSIVVGLDHPAELPLTVQRHSAPNEPLGAITVEAIDLPSGVTADAVISEAAGETAEKVTIKLTSTGVAFSGPIRIRATTDQPRPLIRFARVPSKYSTSIATIWLTAVGTSATSDSNADESASSSPEP